MTELFSSNLNIITRRWPKLASRLLVTSFDDLDACLVIGSEQTISVNGVQLSSRYNRQAEAQLFIDQLPKNITHISVYGVGLGDVFNLLIDDSQIEQIDVNLLNLSLFALVLSHTDQSEWLNDPRVNLIDKIDQYRLAKFYIALPADLYLISDDNAVIRDLIVYENNREFVNSKHKQNTFQLKLRFESNIDALKRDPDAKSLQLTHGSNAAFVIGSGPSLEQHYDYLTKQIIKPLGSRPLFIAVDTALVPLLANGICPDLLVSIEYNISMAYFPENIPETIGLVYFPRIPNSVVKAWPGPKYNAYSTHCVYDELQSLIPKMRLFSSGSVIHPAIDLAVNLKVTDLTLFGCDFCYPQNKSHAYWQGDELNLGIKNAKHWVFNGHGHKVMTDLNFRGYLRSLERYIRSKKHISFYQSSLDSAKILGVEYRECNG